MQENFLHYIWQFQQFDKNGLLTSFQDEVRVLHPGFLNTDAGPDFSNTRIRLGKMEWHGHTEIHIKSSDWHLHGHGQNPAYDNVVLHVVWENDQPVYRKDGTPIPAIELKHRVNMGLLEKYKDLVNEIAPIPCQQRLPEVKELIRLSMVDKAVLSRLDEKADQVIELYEKNKRDWENTSYQLLANNFGFKVNSEPFFTLSQCLPYKVLAKHSDNLLQMEALLFGQAGFLNKEKGDGYYNLLKREYNFLRYKYRLDTTVEAFQWKFLRLRPVNFPVIRIAQFAKLLYEQKNLFGLFNSFTYNTVLQKRLSVVQSQYWQQHFNFGKESKKPVPGLGNSSVENILINTVVPILAALGKVRDDYSYTERAIEILNKVPCEDNKIIRLWKEVKWPVKTAFESQGLHQLFQKFCQQKRCLSCNIGVSLLRHAQNI
jgi:hypothetical protein